MFTPKVIIGFSRYTDAALNQKANHIYQCMTGNAHFTTPTPALTVLLAANTAYGDALAKVVDGSKQDTVIKNEARAALVTVLSQLGLYVQLTSNGSASIMLSSGFDITEERTPVGILAQPTNFSVTPVTGVKGSVYVSVKAVSGAHSYQYEYTGTPVTATSVWTIITDTSSGITINGLQSGKEYAFRVAGIGADPTRTYTDVISSFVL